MKKRSLPYSETSPSGSPSIGIRPLPSLPVDSAISCSAQAPKSAIFLRGQDRHLVAAFEAGDAHREPELHAGIFMRRHVRAAGAHHRKRMVDQAAHVDAGGRGRHQPERRQHRIAPADRGVAMEDAGKALLGRDLLQRRAGIGDRDEAMAGLVRADRLRDAIEEIILHHVRLGGAAGLAGDDEQRLA